MRIALSSVHCWPDVRRGGERYAHELGAALMRAGHDVTLLSTGTRPGRGTVLGVPVHRLPVRRLKRYGELGVEEAFGAQALAHLGPEALRRLDIWHATSTGDAAAAALVGRTGRVRTVFTDHGFPARRSREARPDHRLHSYVARHVGAYVCVSDAAGAYLRADYGREPSVVAPGVRWAEHATGSRDPRPTLLYAGSLSEPRKGVGLLLEAAALLAAKVPDLQVWLLGPGSPGPVPALVTRCGLVDDATLRTAYASAWATVLPSTAESFGMTVVESLASGTPAVALADGGGPAEVITAEVGRLAGSGAQALADACEQALDLGVFRGIQDICRERARDFDWDGAIVPSLLEVYGA